jgi:hypothetical protein
MNAKEPDFITDVCNAGSSPYGPTLSCNADFSPYRGRTESARTG